MTTTRTLDRRVHFDPRSRAYPIRALLDTTQPRSYSWRCDTWLNQGREGACVGYAWAHEAAARPVVRAVTDTTAQGVYRRARQLDPWPGEDYDGTSVLAGAKAAREAGFLTEYRWAFGLTDVLAAISRRGPVIFGVNWHEGMWDTDAAGFIHADGPVVGGHAILGTGVNVRARTVTLHNSWGRGWGRAGKALISWDDLGWLLADDGECCVPVTRTAEPR